MTNKSKNKIATEHQNFLSVHYSVSAMALDTLNTLGEVTIPRANKGVITLLLQQQRQRRESTGVPEDVNENETMSSRNKLTVAKVSRGSISTLAHGVWVNDEIMHFLSRVLIAPVQKINQSKVHIYSTFFMSRLHDKGTGGRGYNFETVKNDDSRIEGGLGSLDELYIPISLNTVHWNFI